MQYLEQQFYSNPKTGKKMNWKNYGEWHIDHIIPLAYFDLTIEEELIQAWYYTNLQPLWAEENLKKGAKHDLH
jgi:5-methylcytosine-specific restriction endonuclease McrA